ncbi:MAG: flagellar export chaperone FlgN [Brevinema sp.]
MIQDLDTASKLIEILLQMKTYIQKIFDIEEQKYDVIKNMDMEQLVIYNEEEVTFVQKVDNLENNRLELTTILSTIVGCSPNTTISQLALLLPQEHQQKILDTCAKIKTLCNRLAIVTERNEYILQYNIEVITQISDLSQGDLTEQYNNQGMTADIHKQHLYMLDQTI